MKLSHEQNVNIGYIVDANLRCFKLCVTGSLQLYQVWWPWPCFKDNGLPICEKTISGYFLDTNLRSFTFCMNYNHVRGYRFILFSCFFYLYLVSRTQMCQNINCKLCCCFFSFCPLYFKCCMVVTYIKEKSYTKCSVWLLYTYGRQLIFFSIFALDVSCVYLLFL